MGKPKPRKGANCAADEPAVTPTIKYPVPALPGDRRAGGEWEVGNG